MILHIGMQCNVDSDAEDFFKANSDLCSTIEEGDEDYEVEMHTF